MTSNTSPVELLYIVAQQLNASLDLTEVLGRVLRLTLEATQASRASLLILNEQAQVTHHILARPNQSAEVLEQNLRLVMSEGLSGWIYQNQRAAIIADTAQDKRWVQLPDDDQVTKSVLGVPLIFRGRVNGLLTLHHESPGFFNETHLMLGTGIADQAAVAVENARLFTQVKSEREALYALLQGLPMPLLVIADDQLIFRNRIAERSLRIKQTGAPLADIAGGEALAQALVQLRTAEFRAGVEMTWPDGRIFQVSLNQVTQHGLVVALDDITTLKELNEMKTQFVETVSHDLKNPISQIRGFARLLEDETLSEQGRLNLAQINQSAGYMLALIEDLLALVQIEAGVGGTVQPCDLAEVAAETLPTFSAALAEKGLRLTTQLADPAPVAADPLRLGQIITNLVSNAIKYTPAGGAVTVEVSQAANEVLLRVSDTGRGIPLLAQSQLFQKFYRVPISSPAEWVEGTGLGLSIVKAIADEYSGRVWVESEVGVGSTFGCALPLLK